MKRLLIKLLNILGLVTAGRHGVVTARLKDAESRAKKLTKLIDASRGEARTWKAKASDIAQQVRSVEKDATRHADAAEKRKAEIEKQQREIEKRGHEIETLRADIGRLNKKDLDLDALRKRLDESERELAIAREHLMAVEVKLDILEGAANVLDVRTRSVIAQQAGKTNAPV